VRRFAGDDAQEVIVIRGGEAPGRSRRWRRRPPAPTPPVTRATVIAAGEREEEPARAWLAAAGEAEAAAALAVLNRAVHCHAIAAADPYVAEVAPWRVLGRRLGYGTGEEVAEGRWPAGRELAPATPPRERSLLLRPQERLAALLSGRDVALAAETLALRARLDLDQGREREAALELRGALEVGLAELESWRELGGMGERLAELRGHVAPVGAAAAAALAGGLAPAQREALAAALGRLEAALRARVAGR